VERLQHKWCEGSHGRHVVHVGQQSLACQMHALHFIVATKGTCSTRVAQAKGRKLAPSIDTKETGNSPVVAHLDSTFASCVGWGVEKSH
jgi:hypothetical protein